MTLVVILISLAVALQSIEHILLQRKLRDLDPWGSGQAGDGLYLALQWLRLAAALAAGISQHWAPTVVMAVATYLTAVRHRGTFNGGSDTVTIHVLIALGTSQIWPQLEIHALIYIAVFASLSYFAAGVAKLFSVSWRSGAALSQFLLFSNAAFPNRFTAAVRRRPDITRKWSWVAMGWEILFPLALFFPAAAWIFLVSGVAFHLLNFYFFGLNRFFWAWLATYPAIALVSQQKLFL